MKNYAKIFNYICAGLLALLLVTQFLPFWSCNCKKSCEGGKELSVSSYVWFPSDHKHGLTKELDKAIDDFEVADVATTPVLIFVSCVIGFVLCIRKADKPLAGIVPFIGGLSGTLGYLTNPALQMGQNWVLHLVASILVLLTSLVVLSKLVTDIIAWYKANHPPKAK